MSYMEKFFPHLFQRHLDTFLIKISLVTTFDLDGSCCKTYPTKVSTLVLDVQKEYRHHTRHNCKVHIS